METNSYQIIKDFINEKLSRVDGILPRTRIYDEIQDMKKLLSEFGPVVFARFLSVSSINPLADDDWERMTRELETHYNVAMPNGILIQGTEQQSRDNTWWTGKEKLINNCFYWNRYQDFLRKQLPPDVLITMDEDTDVVMNNLENPTAEQFSRYGMVVGHVQSGKTANYSALVCKAADAGYKFIVVIAGGINNLRNQTQERLNEAFVGFQNGTAVGVGKLSGVQMDKLPISLTTNEQDFNKRDANKIAQALNLDNIKSPIILVIKKHSSTLQNVISWLETQYKNQIANHAMLMIDDESDYASINYKDEDDPASINKNLRKLLGLFQKSAYVAYTATPYANIFIDHLVDTEDLGKDLFPEDFIYALQVPTNYFGARRIFLESGNRYLVPIKDHGGVLPLKHKIDMVLSELPESLWDAVRLFIINVAVRRLRGQGNKHNSMLVHVTRFTSVHKQVSALIETYFEKLKKHVNAYGKLSSPEQKSDFINDLKETFRTRHEQVEFSWEDVLQHVCEIVDTVVIRQVHKDTKIPLEYRKDTPTNAIVIGGTSLSRGFTLEGLSVSYFLRNTVFYDTLMQMGRWFGYRTDYEDICRIYMTKEMINNFKLIIEATEDLFDDFDEMSKNKMTPKDFGLAVKHHPDSGLQVTARNKLKNTKDLYFEMKLDGKAKETSLIIKDGTVNKGNIDTIRWVVEAAGSKFDKVNNSYVWKEVDRTTILNFLRNYKVHSIDPFGITSRMPIDFVIKYAEEIDTKWDVALYSGDSTIEYEVCNNVNIYAEERQVTDRGAAYEVLNRQVSSGAAEAIVFDKDERKGLGSKRKQIRAQMKRPLLMLHLLDVRKSGVDTLLAAFGVSFPGGIKSKGRTIKLKINSVYIQQLLEQEASDD